jgi:hypothetical protein
MRMLQTFSSSFPALKLQAQVMHSAMAAGATMPASPTTHKLSRKVY